MELLLWWKISGVWLAGGPELHVPRQVRVEDSSAAAPPNKRVHASVLACTSFKFFSVRDRVRGISILLVGRRRAGPMQPQRSGRQKHQPESRMRNPQTREWG